jgi:uncharacterized membrane protein
VDEWLAVLTHHATTAIMLIALVAIVYGTLEACVNAVRLAFVRESGHERRVAWLRYARWLVAGLTFQLAADILETAVAPTWEDLGKLAAIAAIRTALNYFLERDVAEVRRTEAESRMDPPSPARAA